MTSGRVRKIRWTVAFSAGASLVAIAAACSSGSATGPTISRNAQLIERFDSMAVASTPFRALEFRLMIELLAEGAPVQHVTIDVNGKAAPYALIAALDVNDFQDVPLDSDVVLYAWRGRDADTIVLFQYYPRGNVAISLSAPNTVQVESFGGGSGIAVALTRGEVCQSIPDALGAADTLPRINSCRLETISVSATAELRGSGPTPQRLTLVPQPLSAIRLESDLGS